MTLCFLPFCRWCFSAALAFFKGFNQTLFPLSLQHVQSESQKKMMNATNKEIFFYYLKSHLLKVWLCICTTFFFTITLEILEEQWKISNDRILYIAAFKCHKIGFVRKVLTFQIRHILFDVTKKTHFGNTFFFHSFLTIKCVTAVTWLEQWCLTTDWQINTVKLMAEGVIVQMGYCFILT